VDQGAFLELHGSETSEQHHRVCICPRYAAWCVRACADAGDAWSAARCAGPLGDRDEVGWDA
jgi:hypothetical protein